MDLVRIGINRHQALFRRPMRQVEQQVRTTVDARPLDAPHPLETRRTELERTAVEQYASAALVHLPQSAAVRAILAPLQQMPMLVHTSELQHPVLIDNEFLIHNIANIHVFWISCK